jgi:hypothetical protein
MLRPEKTISHKRMQIFFHEKARLGHPMFAPESLICEKLPEDSSNNTSTPCMPYLTEINDDYIEFPRVVYGVKGVVMFMLSFLAIINSVIFFLMIKEGGLFYYGFLTMILILSVFYLLPLTIRYVYFTPHVLPVRFNRKKQKIYFYERKVNMNPYSRWPVTINVMDWGNVQAFHVTEKVYKGLPYRGLHFVSILRGTKYIMGHMVLYIVGTPWSLKKRMTYISYIESIWCFCQRYMEFRIDSMGYLSPPSPWFLANKWLIKWPDEFDKESRSVD